MTLTITRIKPNPTGKDRSRYGAQPSQLAAEWVDFRNDSPQTVSLEGVALYHKAYSGTAWRWERITTFSGDLPAQKVVRVHAGRLRSISVISAADQAGADYHLFTGEDAFVWNNREGDQPLLFRDSREESIDTAAYDPNPPEGVVLVRHGAKLVGQARASGW